MRPEPSVTQSLVQAFFVILPIVVAGLSFIVILKKQWWMSLRVPLDKGQRLGGQPIFGSNKTWLAFIIMPGMTLITSLTLGYGWPAQTASVSPSFFSEPGLWWKAILYGLAYPVGELPNSFVKRRLGIPPGGRASTPILRRVFAVVDQADSIIACAGVLFFFFRVDLFVVLVASFLGIGIHCFTDWLMVHLSLKKIFQHNGTGERYGEVVETM